MKELDVQDELEVFSCATYAAEIYHNLFESEASKPLLIARMLWFAPGACQWWLDLGIAAQKLRRPSTTYMESFQTDLSPQMRTILVDWMVEVAVVCILPTCMCIYCSMLTIS